MTVGVGEPVVEIPINGILTVLQNVSVSHFSTVEPLHVTRITFGRMDFQEIAENANVSAGRGNYL